MSARPKPLRRPGLVAVLAALLPTCIPASCGPIKTVPQQQWEKWKAAGIASYNFRLTRDCVPAVCPPLSIRVRDGVAVRIIDDYTGNPPDRHFPSTDLLTIDAIFAYLVANPPHDDVFVRVDYDSQFGFPTAIDIDRPGFDTSDTIRITDFTKGE